LLLQFSFAALRLGVNAFDFIPPFNGYFSSAYRQLKAFTPSRKEDQKL